MKEIQLTQGFKTVVDDDDFEWISKLDAHALRLRDGYVVACVILHGKWLYLHRAIMRPPRGLVVDHINHDPLDNRKANLRIATVTENGQNRRKNKRRSDSSSRFKGVTFSKKYNVWHATICVNGQQIYLGQFTSETDAAAAYNEAAMKHFDRFAHPNTLEAAQ